VLRPFPIDDVRRALGKAKKVVVVDRNIGFSIGGIWAQEIKAALWNARIHVPIFGFIAGIGGRDVTPEVLGEMLEITEKLDYPEQETYWIGVKDEELSHI
jgi:pyruvate/2-oxoacid:ferredoxin oxidoreductase alpha subunit